MQPDIHVHESYFSQTIKILTKISEYYYHMHHVVIMIGKILTGVLIIIDLT